jgi:nucleotide-binding universal stress UspA family protein
MSYKTILVHVDGSRRAAQRMRIAIDLAAQHEAHLIGIAATGLPRRVQGNGIASLEDMVLMNQIDELRDAAHEGLADFEKAVQGAGLSSWERLLIDDELGEGLALPARYADLMVLGQFDPDDRHADLMRGMPEHVLLNVGHPALIIPYAGSYTSACNQPLVAWDGSPAASRAIAGAMPLLRDAGIVRIVVFNAMRYGDLHGKQAGADLAVFLARHGLRIEVMQENTEQDIGSALLALAADANADLLVMGCYGHSRLRDMFVGSASRTVLNAMTLPVLMAH